MTNIRFAETALFESSETRYQRNYHDADGYHARACQFAEEGQPASLIFNVASVAIECYLIALCARYDVMPFNHNYGCLMDAAQEAVPSFPEPLNRQIRSLDSIFGICSLDNYQHGIPVTSDAQKTLDICRSLVDVFEWLAIVPHNYALL
jgi:hypothetical protein